MDHRNTQFTPKEIVVVNGSKELFGILVVATVVGGVTHNPGDAAVAAQALAELLRNIPNTVHTAGRTNLD